MNSDCPAPAVIPQDEGLPQTPYRLELCDSSTDGKSVVLSEPGYSGLHMRQQFNEGRQFESDRQAAARASHPSDPLFQRRSPEESARQMARVLVNLLECQMATLEGMPARTSKSERARQEAICDKYLREIVDLDIPVGTASVRGHACIRVEEAMRALLASGHEAGL